MAVSEAVDTRAVVEHARRLNPTAQIIARTRYLGEVKALHELGANQVIPEEFETSLELTGRVLAAYGAPPHVVLREKEALRREGYGLLLSPSDTAHPTLEALRDLSSLASVPVPAGSAAVGRSLRELDLRQCTGATVVAVERAGELQLNPSPDFRLESQDALVSFANGTALQALEALLACAAGEGAAKDATEVG